MQPKEEQIMTTLLYIETYYKSHNIKNGVNDMTVIDSEMRMR